MSGSAVRVEGVSIRYGSTLALQDVHLHVEEGEYLGIIGPNGGGKTTLLRAILGLIPVCAGRISLFGRSGSPRVSIGYVPQLTLVDRQFPITVREVVLTGRQPAGLSPFYRYARKDHDAADELLDEVGLSGHAQRRVCELSGGEFQRMLIARALAVRPRLLLLDEPTASVDAQSRQQIYALLERLHADMTIILVTHDLFAVSAHVSQLACLDRTLVYHGDPELGNEQVSALYGCPVDLIAHGVPHRVLKEHTEARKS